MIKWWIVLFAGILTSMFYFPFEFTFLPGINTKMLLAVVGLVFLVYTFVQRREFSIPKTLLILLVISALVSLASLFSITYNETPDTSYVSYIVSAAVWLSAAYSVCFIIFIVHNRIDVPLIINYLTGVCVFQCIIALFIDYNPGVQQFVDRFIVGGEFFHDIHRLYGIGAGLDVAGTRFSCVLVSIGFLLAYRSKEMSMSRLFLYYIAFAIIAVIGNMIARTTLVGLALGLGLILILGSGIFNPRAREKMTGANPIKVLGATTVVLLVAIPLVSFFYRTNEQFYELMRFGFEGFFSLVETGEWQVSSNDVLESMVVWPEELRTWIIGDGYFVSERIDPNYVGPVLEAGYYMGTDIGYCRFLFYFGVVGLIAISTVIVYAAIICCTEFKEYTILFLIALLAGFIMWWKAATDIFVFFSIFICAAYIRNEQLDSQQHAIDNTEILVE